MASTAPETAPAEKYALPFFALLAARTLWRCPISSEHFDMRPREAPADVTVQRS